ITITPMALLMTHLAAPMGSSNMPVERVLETVLGAVIGILIAILLSSIDDRAYLWKRSRGEDGAQRDCVKGFRPGSTWQGCQLRAGSRLLCLISSAWRRTAGRCRTSGALRIR